MTTTLSITRVGPLTTIQDAGRFGMLSHGISASGPMDRAAYALAGALVSGGNGAIEITTAGIDLSVTAGACTIGLAGGSFVARHNETPVPWPGRVQLSNGDRLTITPGPSGNFGYLRFAGDLAIPPVLGSIATSTRAGLGGHHGRALVAGDVLTLSPVTTPAPAPPVPSPTTPQNGPIRIIWGLHADLFSPAIRQGFLS
ncbi:MAG: urea amidolyase, partial [Alphaproteobacteria bacterium]|nr:urea amidolyase [Alphaproteobacteria bacterium]